MANQGICVNSVDRLGETVFTKDMNANDLHSFATNPSAPSICDTIECHAQGCTHRIFHIPERGAGANFCLDHAADMDRAANGWTVWNSAN